MIDKTVYNGISELVEGKNILCVPIISSINRETGEYKLDADGNINRIITTFWNFDEFKSLTIILPSKHVEGSEKYMTEWVNMKSSPEHEIKILWSDAFGIHAGEQRSNYFVITSMAKFIYENVKLDEVDVAFMESQGLILHTSSHLLRKTVFWNYTCETNNKSRSFLRGYKDINEILFRECRKSIVASPEQVDYFSSVEGTCIDDMLYLPIFMDLSIPLFKYTNVDVIETTLKKYRADGYQVFYLPYRMTDEGYQMDDVIAYINGHESEKKLIVYSDPNNSHFMEKLFLSGKFDTNVEKMRVSTDRNTYYTILNTDAGIIIPYFEDIAYINHASVQEFIDDDRCKCKIVLKKFDVVNPYNVNRCKRVSYIQDMNK